MRKMFNKLLTSLFLVPLLSTTSFGQGGVGIGGNMSPPTYLPGTGITIRGARINVDTTYLGSNYVSKFGDTNMVGDYVIHGNLKVSDTITVSNIYVTNIYVTSVTTGLNITGSGLINSNLEVKGVIYGPTITGLQSNIDVTSNALHSVDTNLQDQINIETNRAYNSETNIQNNINIASNSLHIVDTNLQDQINIETNRAYSAETNLSARIDGISGFNGTTITLDDSTNYFSRWMKYVVRFAYTPPSIGTIYYVSTNGNDANDGLSWTSAVATISQGASLAGFAGEGGNTVWVGDGTYLWNGDTNEITLSAPGVVASYNLHGAIIDGGYDYGGFWVDNVDAKLAGFVITNASIGVTLNLGTVEYCIIENCTDGGITLNNVETLLENSIIRNNYKENNNDAGGVKMANCGIMRNCLIYGNQSADSSGGGVYVENACTIENCTIVGNKAISPGAGGIYYNNVLDETNVFLRNSIVMFNTTNDTDYCDISLNSTVAQGACVPVVINSCIGPVGVSVDDVPIGMTNYDGINGCFTNDPLFVSISMTNWGTNYIGGDFNLQSSSPCIDTGTNQDWAIRTYDLAYNRRIANAIIDIGVYEYASSNPPVTWKTEASIDDYFSISREGTNLVVVYPESNVFVKSVTAPEFSGGGAGLTGITAPQVGAVATTGGTMDGPLTNTTEIYVDDVYESGGSGGGIHLASQEITVGEVTIIDWGSGLFNDLLGGDSVDADSRYLMGAWTILDANLDGNGNSATNFVNLVETNTPDYQNLLTNTPSLQAYISTSNLVNTINNSLIIKLGTSTNLVYSNLYYLASGSVWSNANASTNSTSKGLLGLALGSSVSTNGLLVNGIFPNVWNFTSGTIIYVGTNDNSLTTTIPSNNNCVVRIVGYAIDPSNILFNPDRTFIEISP
jgi:hypothetical protein